MSFLRLKEHGGEEGDDSALFLRVVAEDVGGQAGGCRGHQVTDVRELKCLKRVLGS